MKVQVLGCSHHTSPLAVRERMAFGPHETCIALAGLRRRFPDTEAVLLSTCNRIELYTATIRGDGPTRKQIGEFFADFHQLQADDVIANLYDRHGHESVRHLFLVASSLDSMVVGEAQISSQVKLAYRLANQQKTTGPLTHAIFQAAARVARRVAAETGIHERRVSVPSVAVAEFVGQVFERLDDKRVLVLGAGEMADETLQYLCKEGIRQVTIVNRRAERAVELARRYAGRVAHCVVRPWDDRYHQMASSDLVIAATGAKQPVIQGVAFEPVRRQRRGRPLVILDLGVPRDFDPQIGGQPGVYLFSIDDMHAVCERNRRQRESELPKALEIIEQETARFMGELNFREVAPVLQRLRESWEEPKEIELNRLLNRLPHLDESAQREIRRAFDRLTNKLLHPPAESLRAESRHGAPTALIDSLARLFRFRV